VGQVGALTTWAAGIAVSPLFSEAYAHRDTGRVQRLLALSTWATFLPSLVVLAGLVFAGRFLLGIFGQAFQDAYVPAILIAAAAAVNASGGLAGTLLYMTSHERTVVFFSVASLAVLVIMGFVLGLTLGVPGVALAVLLAGALRDVGL